MHVILILLIAFYAVAIAVGIYRSLDHSYWKPNAKPNLEAKIIDISRKKIKLAKNGVTFETTVTFDDGFVFTTVKTNRENHIFTYEISIDEDLARKIIDKAITKHEAAVKRIK